MKLADLNARRHPFALGIFLTRRCNFNCIYCAAERGSDPEDKLTLKELDDLIRQAKSLNIKLVSITGEGEPFLDDNLFPFLDVMEKYHLHCQIFTNGSLINKSIAEDLLKRRVSLFFKLNSFNEEIQDTLAGKKNCHQWVEYTYNENGIPKTRRIPLGLRNLLEVGFTSRSLLHIETVITKLNLNCIPLTAKFCKSQDIDFYIERLTVLNRAADNYKILRINKDEEAKLYRELSSILGVKFRLSQHTRCIFETSPFIDISGNIRFCFTLPANIGNIRDLPLEQLHLKEQRLRKSLGLRSKLFSQPGDLFRKCAVRKYVFKSYCTQ